MDNIRRGACCVVVAVLLYGCAPHTISGAYIAHGQQFAELLQVTQSQDGQLLGTLNHTAVQPNGTIEQFALSISGTTDGHSLTLIGKVNEPLAIPTNMSGTIEGDVITITQPNGMEQFAKTNAADYQADIQRLNAQAVTIHQQVVDQQRQQQAAGQTKAMEDAKLQQISDINEAAGNLVDELNAYVTKIQTHRDLASQELGKFHAAHAKALAQAQHGWEIEQRYPKGSVQASQMYLAINQISLDLSTFDLPWQQFVDTAHTHVQQFDGAIFKSPCHQQGPELVLSNCLTNEPAAIAAYKTARTMVVDNASDVSNTMGNDDTTMKSLVDQAQAYSTN